MSATTASPTIAPEGARVVDVIDIGGGEVLGLTVQDDAVWAISFREGSIARIDPSSDAVVLNERLGAGAATALSAGPQLWVGGYGMGSSSKLFRVDPSTGDAIAEVSPGQMCCDLAAGADRIWAIDPGGDLLGIDPMRRRVADRFPVPFDADVHTNVVFGGGSVWVGSDGMALSQIDPATGSIERTIDTGGGPPFLAHGGLVWGAAPERLWAVDPGTGEVVRSIPLDDSMEVISLGIGMGSIWAGIRHPGYVAPSSSSILRRARCSRTSPMSRSRPGSRSGSAPCGCPTPEVRTSTASLLRRILRATMSKRRVPVCLMGDPFQKEEAVKYMLLIHQGDTPTPASPEAWATLSEDEQRAVYADYQAINQTPGVTPGMGLDLPETATTVRVKDGKTLTTDGPFVEIKESIGGYLLFEADDLDAAIELAAKVPAARLGGAVEVRPIVEW